MKVELSQGEFALISPEDADRITAHKWYITRSRTTGRMYATRKARGEDGRQYTVFMHKAILNAPRGQQVDHINGDSMDNRRENLRFCTPTQNMGNRRLNRNNQTGYKGVSYHAASGLWTARVGNSGRGHCSYHDSPEAAAHAYDAAARAIYGEFARLNFGENGLAA